MVLKFSSFFFNFKYIELYGGQGGFFWSNKFDKALIGFFDCLKQLIEFIKQKDSSFQFPYEYYFFSFFNLYNF